MSNKTTSLRHKMKLCKLSDPSLGYSNCVYLNPTDLKELNLSPNDQLLIDEQQVFQVKSDPNLNRNHLAASGLVWKALRLTPETAVGSTVIIEAWNNRATPIIQTVQVLIDTYTKDTHIKAEELETHISNNFKQQIFCKDQIFILKWIQNNMTYWLQITIAAIYESNKEEKKYDDDADDDEYMIPRKQRQVKFGKIDDLTAISLMAKNNPSMKLIYSADKIPKDILFICNPELMGIGGLHKEFAEIFRRAFASRIWPSKIVKQLGIKHIKGILLYGPPGTGKTLIARNIGRMLTENEPKVVNGPSILNKYVGQSEENIRKLFEDAIIEEKLKGDDSSLHIIIFDEIDAICKQRGTSSSHSAVGDTVVNQLLSMIDGVNALNNVLIIGMTNRKDLLDEALLRSGRLEVHIEISLPDQVGREEIFRIHTKLLHDNGYLDENISISELAEKTTNYTGAEIESVVKSAVSYAMQKKIDMDNINDIDIKQLENIKITQNYFDEALKEVLPDLGSKKIDDELLFMYNRGIIRFNEDIDEIIDFVTNILKTMNRESSYSSLMNRQSLLLCGNKKTGKSAMAAYIANKIGKWAFIKIISGDNYVGSTDIDICSSINKIFNDGYKSDKSIIIIDDIHSLIGYNNMGPRFSNSILQSILTCIQRLNTINPNRKIFIIATCKYNVVKQLNLDEEFDYIRNMPLIKNKKQFENILIQTQYHKICKPNINDIINSFQINNDISNGVGIADLLTILELSINDNSQITSKSFLNAFRSKFKSHSLYNNHLVLDQPLI